MTSLLRRLTTMALLCIALTGCGWFGAKDNTPKPAPLVHFTPAAHAVQLWSTSTGYGVGEKYIKLDVAYDNGVVYTADSSGNLTATNANNGNQIWQTDTKLPITAGPTAGNGLVFAGTDNAKVVAVSEKTGQLVWTQPVSSVVLAAPTLYQNTLLIKTIDGKLVALNAQTGKQLWVFSQDVPSLILRGSSSATIADSNVFAGFANGTLIAVTLDNGSQVWSQAIASPLGENDIENMVDIDSKPIVIAGIVYVVTYQGNIAAVNATTGTLLWQHKFSSYQGISADQKTIFASDTESHVWAFDQDTGGIIWRQQALSWRNITGPVLMDHIAVVVGDQEGYLHFLSIKDGRFIARTKVGSKILAAPLVVNHTLYVITANGTLAAYQLR